MRAAFALYRIDFGIVNARRLYGGKLKAAPHATMLPLVGLPADADPPTAALVIPPMDAHWSDPLLLKLASEIGLSQYWRQAGPPSTAPTLMETRPRKGKPTIQRFVPEVLRAFDPVSR